jgi:hypothetical protein|tara:strand:- start:210 stop:371 length:162 start_codon:yes stop_codon:yes gene_type:complete
MKYLFVLDFMDGQVYKYDVRNYSDEHEDYIMAQGHSLANVEWMATDNGEVVTD